MTLVVVTNMQTLSILLRAACSLVDLLISYDISTFQSRSSLLFISRSKPIECQLEYPVEASNMVWDYQELTTTGWVSPFDKCLIAIISASTRSYWRVPAFIIFFPFLSHWAFLSCHNKSVKTDGIYIMSFSKRNCVEERDESRKR